MTGVNAKNPCNAGVLAKAYKNVPHRPRKILDKETVDELIFNAGSIRDRLILELQARCGLRIGEVLNLRVSDLSGRKILIEDPKSGRDAEVAFMPNILREELLSMWPASNCPPMTEYSLFATPLLGTW